MWDFNVILPNQKHPIPQTHTLRIRIGNSLKPSEMIQVVFQGSDEYELEEIQSQMVCKIDFVNAHICTDLKTIITELYDALSKNDDDKKTIKLLVKNEEKIKYSIILLFLTAGIFFFNSAISFFLNHWKHTLPYLISQQVILFSTIGIPVIFLSYVSGRLFADRIIKRNINRLRRNPMFNITKGDINKIGEINKANKKLVISFGINVLYAISINIVVYFIGKIAEYIEKILF